MNRAFVNFYELLILVSLIGGPTANHVASALLMSHSISNKVHIISEGHKNLAQSSLHSFDVTKYVTTK